jgi:hypothetical protein
VERSREGAVREPGDKREGERAGREPGGSREISERSGEPGESREGAGREPGGSRELGRLHGADLYSDSDPEAGFRPRGLVYYSPHPTPPHPTPPHPHSALESMTLLSVARCGSASVRSVLWRIHGPDTEPVEFRARTLTPDPSRISTPDPSRISESEVDVRCGCGSGAECRYPSRVRIFLPRSVRRRYIPTPEPDVEVSLQYHTLITFRKGADKDTASSESESGSVYSDTGTRLGSISGLCRIPTRIR